jgi:hypothetical protein
MALSRREFLSNAAAAAALLSGGLYGLIDEFARPVTRRSEVTDQSLARHRAATLPREQHLFLDLTTVTDNDTVVTVPPLHHTVVTAKVNVGPTTAALQKAQRVLESAIAKLETSGLLNFTPAGLGLAVVWGLPYFEMLPPALTSAWLPMDLVTSQANNTATSALTDAISFASDPPDVVLEQNDVAFIFASDHQDNIAAAFDSIFHGRSADHFTITSIRKGFVDGHNIGSSKESLTKKMAMQAKLPGAALIPDSAELFLGFTSTQQAALGQSTIANFETLPGVTDQWPHGYFVHGTTMHLSHIYEDLITWYGGPFAQQVGAAFSPRDAAATPPGTHTLPDGPSNVESLTQVQDDFTAHGFVGHSSSMQPASRLAGPVTDNYGNPLPTGTAIPQRADFNTLDNPFFFSSNRRVDHMSTKPAAGLHFVIFMPTTGSFNRLRQAMDGQYGQDANLGSGAVHGPFNRVLQTTHRQNFLVPPRAHRSFPLAELLT